MSEEEKKAIKNLQEVAEKGIDIYEEINVMENEDAIRIVLNLIDKQQEKIEERDTRIQEEINENCKLKTELYGNSISKNTIKAKIKEVSNGTYDAKIILEKLLEE